MRGFKSSFPGTFAAYDQSLLLSAYEEGPRRLRAALEGLSHDAYDERPIADKWSVNEIVMHMVDSDLMGSTRFRFVLAAETPEFPGYDQDAWAKDLKYRPYDGARLQSALGLFAALRSANIYLLRNANAGDWNRAGIHAEMGPVTLRNLLELYADHSERHIRQIVERRRLLGHGIDLPPLLPDLLY